MHLTCVKADGCASSPAEKEEGLVLSLILSLQNQREQSRYSRRRKRMI